MKFDGLDSSTYFKQLADRITRSLGEESSWKEEVGVKCPGGIYFLHPLWQAYLQELWALEKPKTVWEHLRTELDPPKKPAVPKWIPCPGEGCGHKEDLLFTLGA